MIDWQNRVFDVLTDPDSEEHDAALCQMLGALHDRDSAWHTQAVGVLHRLWVHFSASPRQEALKQENMRFRMSPPSRAGHDAIAVWDSDMAAMRDEAPLSRYGW